MNQGRMKGIQKASKSPQIIQANSRIQELPETKIQSDGGFTTSKISHFLRHLFLHVTTCQVEQNPLCFKSTFATSLWQMYLTKINHLKTTAYEKKQHLKKKLF